MEPRMVTVKNGRDVVVRRARPEDAERVIESVNEVGAERRFILTEKLAMTVEQEEEFISRWGDGAEGQYLVAEAEGRIIGGSLITRGQNPKTRHTAGLGIHIVKEWRGAGLGEAMMRENIEWARGAGVRKV